MIRFVLSLAAAACLIALPASAAERHALIVANADYDTLAKLTNPPADAQAVAASLREVGFNVSLVTNADRDLFFDALRDFRNTLRDAPEGSTGLFYFAGHGAAFDGQNWLMPVDADPADAVDFARDAIELSDVYDVFKSAPEAAHFVILDACRNDGRTRSAAGGLTQPSGTPQGVFVAFSAEVGEVALDGPAGGLSPFAAAFTGEITQPGPAAEVFQRVATRVYEATNRRQIPMRQNGLIGAPFFFASAQETPAPAPVTAAPQPDDASASPAPRFSAAAQAARDAVSLIPFESPTFDSEDTLRAIQSQVPFSAIVEAAAGDDLIAARAKILVSLAHYFGINAPKDADAAARFAREACTVDTTVGCTLLAQFLTRGLGVDEDPQQANIYFDSACNLGLAPACEGLATNLLIGRGIEIDRARAARLFRESCALGSQDGCFGYARSFSMGAEGAPDEAERMARAYELHEENCARGYSQSCYIQGARLHTGTGVAQDRAAALRVLDPVCEDGNLNACMTAGLVLSDQNWAERDPARAVSYFKKACDGGFASGCNLAETYAN